VSDERVGFCLVVNSTPPIEIGNGPFQTIAPSPGIEEVVLQDHDGRRRVFRADERDGGWRWVEPAIDGSWTVEPDQDGRGWWVEDRHGNGIKLYDRQDHAQRVVSVLNQIEKEIE